MMGIEINEGPGGVLRELSPIWMTPKSSAPVSVKLVCSLVNHLGICAGLVFVGFLIGVGFKIAGAA